MTEVHPIEAESYRRIEPLLPLPEVPAELEGVCARILHATADPELAASVVCTPGAPAALARFLAAGSGVHVITDVAMTRDALTTCLRDKASCLLPPSGEPALPATPYGTRSASGVVRAVADLGNATTDTVFVIGCAPTALEVLLDSIEHDALRPAGIVALPVGYVGAAAAKDRLLRVAQAHGIAALTNAGDRGGSAATGAAVNAIWKASLGDNAGPPPAARNAPGSIGPDSSAWSSTVATRPALLVIAHGSRSQEGADQVARFVESLRQDRPETPIAYCLIEFAEETGGPELEDAVREIATRDPLASVVTVPLVLLGAGHMKDDGPRLLEKLRRVKPDIHAVYAGALGIHPLVLDAAEASARTAGGGSADAVVLVSRGSTDPDANADLAKVARLLGDGRGIGGNGTARGAAAVSLPGSPSEAPLGLVEAAFVSLAPPSLPIALDRCRLLGALKITVVPYFLFTGILLDRIRREALQWNETHTDCSVQVASEMWPDPRIAELTWLRYDEAVSGHAAMNCDLCVYRSALPGYEWKQNGGSHPR